jgi:hypothetical protein
LKKYFSYANEAPLPSGKLLNMIRIQSTSHQTKAMKVKLTLRQLAAVVAFLLLLLAANGLQIQQPADIRSFNIPHNIYKLSLRERTNQSIPVLPRMNDKIKAIIFELCLYEHC